MSVSIRRRTSGYAIVILHRTICIQREPLLHVERAKDLSTEGTHQVLQISFAANKTACTVLLLETPVDQVGAELGDRHVELSRSL